MKVLLPAKRVPDSVERWLRCRGRARHTKRSSTLRHRVARAVEDEVRGLSLPAVHLANILEYRFVRLIRTISAMQGERE